MTSEQKIKLEASRKTDEELIWALKCCGSDGYHCGVCPCFSECEPDSGNRAPELAANRLEALLAENERLKEQNFEEYCEDMHEYHCPRVKQLQQEIDHLREATKMVPRWVSVEERLPEDKQDVIAISNDGVENRVYPANYDHGKWFDCFFMERNRHTTHWMPLPEPPSTEGVE